MSTVNMLVRRLGEKRAAAWLENQFGIPSVPCTASDKRMIQRKLFELHLYTERWDKAIAVAQDLDQETVTAGERPDVRWTARMLEGSALKIAEEPASSPPESLRLLEAAAGLGTLSVGGTRVLAEAWASDGRKDPAACKMYCRYVGICLDRPSGGTIRGTDVVRLLREYVAHPNGDEPARQMVINRLQLLAPHLGWPARELGRIWSGHSDDARVSQEARKKALSRACRMLETADEVGELEAKDHLTLGRLYHRDGRRDEAKKAFETARDKGVPLADVNLMLALICLEGNEIKAARGLLEEVVGMNPGDLRANAMLGQVYLDDGEFDEAKSRFDLVLAGRPRDRGSRWGLARCAQAEGRDKEAKGLLEALVNEDPADPWPHFALGNIEEARSNEVRARAHYREALRLDPGVNPARVRLGVLLAANLATVDEARTLLEGIENLTDTDPDAAETLARLRAAAGEHSDAVNLWTSLKELSEDAENSLASSLHELGKSALAAKNYGDALAWWLKVPTRLAAEPVVLEGKRAALIGLIVESLKTDNSQALTSRVKELAELDSAGDKTGEMWQSIVEALKGDSEAMKKLKSARPRSGAESVLVTAITALGSGSGAGLRDSSVTMMAGFLEEHLALANLLDWDTEALAKQLVARPELADSIPVDKGSWLKDLVVDRIESGDLDRAFKLLSTIADIDTSDELRSICLLEMAASALDNDPDLDAAIRYLDQLKTLCGQGVGDDLNGYIGERCDA